MSDFSAALRDEVALRAGDRCEYCRLSQVGQEATFHIDHVVPRAAGGPATTSSIKGDLPLPSAGRRRRRLIGNPTSGCDVPSRGQASDSCFPHAVFVVYFFHEPIH